MSYNLSVFIFILLAVLVVTNASTKKMLWLNGYLLIGGVLLRVVGSIGRYEIIMRTYNGFGDAIRYYSTGLSISNLPEEYASSFLSLQYWTETGGERWGTHFVTKISGFILNFIGPSIRGEFLIFSLLSFAGLFLIVYAYNKQYPDKINEVNIFATWVFFFPSLWFWPCSIGKEAIVILSFGLVTYAYTGNYGKTNWPVFVFGLVISFMIRPHIALVIASSAVIAHWMGTIENFRLSRIVEIGIFLIIAGYTFIYMSEKFGIARPDLQGLQEYVEYYQQQTRTGGSKIEMVPLTLLGVPFAIINIWARPFPWEAHNFQSLFAAVEMAALIWLGWKRRHNLKMTIKYWRHDRLLRFVVPMVIIYTLMIGFTMGNLGIIARQRTPVFPFILMFLITPIERYDNEEEEVIDEKINGNQRLAATKSPVAFH